MPIVFVLFVACWFFVLRWFLQKRTFNRLFAFLMMSVLTYISFELMMWSFRLPLPVMLVIGLLPVVCVAYGFRVYDYHMKREKAKNDEKPKREDFLALE
jgi:Ca2+/Na+ antiporter